MTGNELYAITVALDNILRRDLPVGTAVEAAQARKVAAEAYKPTGEKVGALRDEYLEGDVIPDAQVPAFEMRAGKVLEVEIEVDVPVVHVHPNLMLPGSVVAVLVEAGVMEVAG